MNCLLLHRYRTCVNLDRGQLPSILLVASLSAALTCTLKGVDCEHVNLWLILLTRTDEIFRLNSMVLIRLTFSVLSILLTRLQWIRRIRMWLLNCVSWSAVLTIVRGLWLRLTMCVVGNCASIVRSRLFRLAAVLMSIGRCLELALRIGVSSLRMCLSVIGMRCTLALMSGSSSASLRILAFACVTWTGLLRTWGSDLRRKVAGLLLASCWLGVVAYGT